MEERKPLIKPKILIIDADFGIRLNLKEALDLCGFEITLAASMVEARKSLKESTFALIILDPLLSDGDGYDLLDEIRKDRVTYNVPVLILSSHQSVKDRTAVLTRGANDCIEKPFNIAYLKSRIFAWVGDQIRSKTLDHAKPLDAKDKKILVVDDSATLREMIGEKLRDVGFAVVTADSGEHALETLAAQSFDCALIDLNMPGIGGQETCRQIRATAAWRDLPIIFLTSESSLDIMLDAFNAGADDYILKNINFELMLARLLAQLRRKQTEDENRKIREELVRQELETSKAKSAEEMAAARALLLIELGQKNAELERAKEEALRESRFKTRFLASMSHELRTPLNAIIGFSELLEQQVYGSLSDRQTAYVQNILSSGRHLLSLVADILDLSKIEAGRMSLSREWASLTMVVDAVEQVMKALADKKKIKLEFSIPKSIPDIYMDPVRIKQVLYNLLSNAVKFTPEGGTVRLVVHMREDNQIELAVEDTGIGIKPEDMPKLFKEFERLENTRTDKVKTEGTGLGLVLTKKLMELHGGSVKLESEVNKGTKVTISFPMLRGETMTKITPPDDIGPPQTTILIVEDDMHAAELLAGHLRAVGLSVAFARDGEAALRYTQECLPTAVVLDILIPGVDGWGILSRLKGIASTTSIPVLVTSVVEESERGMLLGAADYLVKPIAQETIWHSLERAGVRLFHVTGLRVLLLDHGSPEMNLIEEHLKVAGCEVCRLSAASDIQPHFAPEVAIVDLMGDPANKRIKTAALLQKLAMPTPPPLIALEESAVDTKILGPHVEPLMWPDAVHMDRFVRTLHRVAKRSHISALLEPRTGLPAAESLTAHLRNAIQRAERELKRVLIVTANVTMPKTQTLGSWDELLHAKLRRSDYVAIMGDTLLLVVYGAAVHEANAVAERFTFVLRQALHLNVSDVHILWYPTDGHRYEEILEKCRERASAGKDLEAAPKR